MTEYQKKIARLSRVHSVLTKVASEINNPFAGRSDGCFLRLESDSIHTPSLREVPRRHTSLANHFLNKCCRAMQTVLKQNLPRSLARPANL